MGRARESGGRDPPLAGLGRFSGLVAIGTAVAVAIAFVGLKLIPRDGGGAESGRTAAPAVERHVAEGPPGPGALQERASTAAPELDGGVANDALGPVARDVERRHEAGELEDAQRRFETCSAGGDLRRTAWIDPGVGVVKLIRNTAGGFVSEEWFDGDGRLREARVRGTAAGRPWTRHVALDEQGTETVRAIPAGGEMPGYPAPPLVRRDPTRAFFAAGCDPAAR